MSLSVPRGDSTESRVQEQRNFAEALSDVAAALNSTLEVDKVLERVLDQLDRVVAYDTANVMLIDAEEAYIVRGRGYQPLGLENILHTWRMRYVDYPILKQMAESGKPLVFADTHAEELWVRVPQSDWIRSYIGAPIRQGDQTIGFINVNSREPGYYRQVQTDQVKAFADQAAIAIENARLYEVTSQRAHRLQLISELATSINQPIPLNQVLQAAASGLARVLDVEQTGIGLLKEQQRIITIVSEHKAPGSPSAINLEIPLDGNPSMEWILEHKKSLAIYDALHDPNLEPIQNTIASRRIKSLLLTPLIMRDTVIGTIGSDAIRKHRNFSPEDVRLAETIAGLLAARIEQAKLLNAAEKNAGELELARALLHLINASPAITQVLVEISDLLTELSGCDQISFYLMNATRDRYAVILAHGVENELDPGPWFAMSDTSAAADILSGKIHQTANLNQECQTGVEAGLLSAGYLSRINIPLRIGGTVYGSLNLMWRYLDGYAETNLALLEQIADAVAMAIDRSRLIEGLKRRDAILNTLAFAADQLLRTRNLGEIMPGLLMRLGEITEASRAYVYENSVSPHGELLLSELYGWDSQQFDAQVTRGNAQKYPYKEIGLSRWVLHLSAGQAINGPVAQFPVVEQMFLRERGVNSLVVVPIFVRDQWWGLLGFDDCQHERYWMISEVEALKNLADSFGSALARLQSEMAEHEQLIITQALRDVAAMMTATMPFNEVLDKILIHVTRVLRQDAANILLLKTGMVSMASHKGYLESGYPNPSEAFPMPVQKLPNLITMVETGVPKITRDTRADLQWLFLPEVAWIRSNLCAPIRFKKQTIGFINLDSCQENFFQEEDAHRLQAFANQAAIAIENARLFEETHQQARQMSLLNRMTRAAIGAKTVSELLDILVIQMVDLFDAQGAFITFWDEERSAARLVAGTAPGWTPAKDLPSEHTEVSLTATVLETNHAMVVPDIGNSHHVDERLMAIYGSGQVLALPLITSGQRLGAVNIVFKPEYPVGMDVIALGEQAAGQVALAIAKARLLEDERLKTAMLTRTNNILTALSHVATNIETATHPDIVLRSLGEELKRLQIYSLVALLSQDKQAIIFRYVSLNSKEVRAAERLAGAKFDRHTIYMHQFAYFNQVIDQRQPVFIDDLDDVMQLIFPDLPARVVKAMNRHLGISSDNCALFLPLVAKEQVMGTIWLWGEGLSEPDIQAASVFASQVALALENARLYSHVKQLSITDDLTGLYNRRGLNELGNREVDRARRFGRSLYALMYDLDDFKPVNDTYGHLVGDEVLKEIAYRSKLCLRSTDVLGRYGGEEFAVLLPESELSGALESAERLRLRIASEPITTSRAKIPMTVSIGVAHLDELCSRLQDLLDRADQGLYLAKRSGKNQVGIYTDV